jgi:hypothetical protein
MITIISSRVSVEVNILEGVLPPFESEHQKEAATSLGIDLSSN